MAMLRIKPVYFHMNAPEYAWINTDHIVAIIENAPNGEDVSQSSIVMVGKKYKFTMKETPDQIMNMIRRAAD